MPEYYVSSKQPLSQHPLITHPVIGPIILQLGYTEFCYAKRDNNCFYTSLIYSFLDKIPEMDIDVVKRFRSRLAEIYIELEAEHGGSIGFDDFYECFVGEIECRIPLEKREVYKNYDINDNKLINDKEEQTGNKIVDDYSLKNGKEVYKIAKSNMTDGKEENKFEIDGLDAHKIENHVRENLNIENGKEESKMECHEDDRQNGLNNSNHNRKQFSYKSDFNIKDNKEDVINENGIKNLKDIHLKNNMTDNNDEIDSTSKSGNKDMEVKNKDKDKLDKEVYTDQNKIISNESKIDKDNSIEKNEKHKIEVLCRKKENTVDQNQPLNKHNTREESANIKSKEVLFCENKEGKKRNLETLEEEKDELYSFVKNENENAAGKKELNNENSDHLPEKYHKTSNTNLKDIFDESIEQANKIKNCEINVGENNTANKRNINQCTENEIIDKPKGINSNEGSKIHNTENKNELLNEASNNVSLSLNDYNEHINKMHPKEHQENYLAIIAFLKTVTSSFLRRNNDRFKPFYGDMTAYCKSKVDRFYVDVGDIVIIALAEALQITIRVFDGELKDFVSTFGDGPIVIDLLIAKSHFEPLFK